jgi:bifunctional non-homologous end joining protein LigD
MGDFQRSVKAGGFYPGGAGGVGGPGPGGVAMTAGGQGGLTMCNLSAGNIAPMLAYPSPPFDSGRHLFEVKQDGWRCLLFLENYELRLQNRRLWDISARFPEFSDLPERFPVKNVVLDGELVVMDQGRSDLRQLQRRAHLANLGKIKIMARQLPASFICFDVLALNGQSYLEAPLMERKQVLHSIMPESELLRESQYITGGGREFFEAAVARGEEGVMAKGLCTPYLIGQRSRHWLKIKPGAGLRPLPVGNLWGTEI